MVSHPETIGPLENWQELEKLHSKAEDLLVGLDRLGIQLAGLHLSMAIEIMRQQHPLLAVTRQAELL